MERLSDTAIEIINDLHTERLEYTSEYIPLIDAANRLAAYEDTGLEPEDMAHWMDYFRAECEGRLEVLPCKVGDHILADGREAIVVWFFGYKTGRFLHVQFLDNAECADIPFYEIGKNRLSDPEETEAALKGGEGL